MPDKALKLGSILLAFHAIGSYAVDGGARLNGIHDRAVAAGGDAGAGAGGDTGGDVGAGAGIGTGGGFGVGVNTGGGNGFGVNVGGNGVNVGSGGAGVGADSDSGGNAGASIGGGVGGDAAGAGANGAGVGIRVGGAGNNGNAGAQDSGGVGVNINGGLSTSGDAGGSVNGGTGASGDAAGNVNGDIGGDVSASIAWPDLEVGVVPGDNGAAPMYTPAASIWSSPPDSSNAEHTGDHRIAAGMFLTASATQDVPAPQYTIQGGPAKVYYFPPSATASAGGEAPEASITPAPAPPSDTESSPVGAGEVGLGGDGLLTTLGTVLSPGYVYLSFSTLFAGCKVGDEMKTIGPNYANTMFSFKSDGISTKCASTMAPGATPAYGPPAAVNWNALNTSLETEASSCWHIAPPAEFLKICPPEWTQQLYWNVDFEPPQMLTQGNAATVTAGAGAAEGGLATAAPSSSVVVTGPTAGATIGTWSTYGGSNGSANGTSNTPFAGGSNSDRGSDDKWRKAAAGLVVGALTAVALL